MLLSLSNWSEAGGWSWLDGQTTSRGLSRYVSLPLSAKCELVGSQLPLQESCHDLHIVGPIDLIIQAEPTRYTLLYRHSEAEHPTKLVSVSSLTLDGGSPKEYEFYFTGTHFGLFNQTLDGDNCLCPAYFEWAQYEVRQDTLITTGTSSVNGHGGTNGHRGNGGGHGCPNGSMHCGKDSGLQNGHATVLANSDDGH